MIGKYKGFYKYDKQKIQKSISHGVTFFFLEITETNGDKFIGTVEDDKNTGGTPGTGVISGELIGDKISFIKQMPIASFVANGQMKTFDKKHPKIYYEGVKIDEKFIGTWKIKFGLLMVGLLFLLGAKTTGTWEMEKSTTA